MESKETKLMYVRQLIYQAVVYKIVVERASMLMVDKTQEFY
jgi:hypothetical protein